MRITDVQPIGRSAVKIIDYMSTREIVVIILIAVLIFFVVAKVMK